MSQQAGAADQLDPVEESNMTLMEHLIELRTRLMWIGGAVIIATLVAMIFAWDIVEILNQPLGGYIPQAIGPTDNLVVFFKVALSTGAAVAMPIIMYQVIAFITPGLYPHERRALLLILPGAMLLFITGVVFAFFVMIPPAVRFLQGFGGNNIRTEWTASLYIGFITRITFWIGVAFQAPLVVGFLARIGLVSGWNLLRLWRQAVVIIAIAAAFITPTVDPVNMTIVMAPLIVLFFFSVGVAYMLYRPREPRDFSEGFIPDEYRDDDSDDDSPPDDNPPKGGPPKGGSAKKSPVEPSDASAEEPATASVETTSIGVGEEAATDVEPSDEETVASRKQSRKRYPRLRMMRLGPLRFRVRW